MGSSQAGSLQVQHAHHTTPGLLADWNANRHTVRFSNRPTARQGSMCLRTLTRGCK